MISLFQRKKTALTTIFPENFIDIHNHLIPGIDDGSKSLDESVVLIKRMHNFGIKNFICTPHVMSGVYDNTPEIINEKLSVLQNHLSNLGLTDIKISAAAEYMLDDNFGTKDHNLSGKYHHNKPNH